MMCVAGLLCCWAGPVFAGSLTAINSTAITAYQGESPTPYFSGPNPYVAQAPIGAEFTTDSLTVQASAAGAGVLVDFTYLTQFSGSATLAGQTVNYADIFLNAGGGYGAGGYSYAISLGDQSANGGLAAGFYEVGSALTSQDIWSSRPNYIFGGAYGANANMAPGQIGYTASAAPTVLTAGQFLSGVTVTETNLGQGWYQLSAEIDMTPAEAAYFADGMDVFWGTGDCANGAFMAEFSSLPMPEPCSAAVLLSGLFYLALRKKV
jgi:hypothetical protein